VIVIPRRDGTGPYGMGPMTGRGAGFCFGRSTNNFLRIISLILGVLGIILYVMKNDALNKKEV
jgi:hypothetical protein